MFNQEQKEYQQNYRRENREKVNKSTRRHYNNNKEHLLEKARKWKAARHVRNPWARTLEYVKQRCTDPNKSNYKWYGGKGIKCLLTLEDLEVLWKRDSAHLLSKPSIDRIDSNKDYFLDNCRYIELSENVRRKND